jgi:hypothetical protein
VTVEWLWAVGLAGVGLFLFARNRAGAASPKTTASPDALNTAPDRELILTILRREIANYLVRLDPDRFLRLYCKAFSAEQKVDGADADERQAELTLIAKRYPYYSDFDLVATRDHVLYADALSMYSIEEIEEHYLALIKFQAIMRASDPSWRFRSPATSQQSVDHCEQYVKRIKDTRFLHRLKAAVDEYFQQWKPSDDGAPYETARIAVYRVPHVAENRYGVHFKDTDEYGLYGSFYDDGRDKTYHSFFRSDRRFEAEDALDHLRIDDRV